MEGGTDERRLEFAKLFEILGIRIVKHRFRSECQNTTDGGERSEDANHASDIYILYLCGELQVGWHLEEEEGAEEDNEEAEEDNEEAEEDDEEAEEDDEEAEEDDEEAEEADEEAEEAEEEAVALLLPPLWMPQP